MPPQGPAPARFCSRCGTPRLPGAEVCTSCDRRFAGAPVAVASWAKAAPEAPPRAVTVSVPPRGGTERLLTLFRLPLAVPYLIAGLLLLLAWVPLGLVSWAWVAATGTAPGWLARFAAFTLRFCTRTAAFLLCAGDAWPHAGGVAVRVADGRQARTGAVLRPLFAVPAWLGAYLFGVVAVVVAVPAWCSIVFAGRVPPSLQEVLELCVGYGAGTLAYWPLCVTGEFPPLPGTVTAGSTAPRADA